MNISSLIITTSVENAEHLVPQIKTGDFCEYHAHKEGKIVVTIEADSVSDEIKTIRKLQSMANVLSVELIYSYCEDELEKERDKLEFEGKIPDWLNDENARAEDVVYNGRIKI